MVLSFELYIPVPVSLLHPISVETFAMLRVGCSQSGVSVAVPMLLR